MDRLSEQTSRKFDSNPPQTLGYRGFRSRNPESRNIQKPSSWRFLDSIEREASSWA